ncbi:MAG: hypothetical protein KBD73_00855 [Candidatus Magasanikbacteria bacterium]|nr:hypothetical protein [Candidatus Magasanikbacteria bacterium]
MTDEFVRHLVAAIATIISAVIFYAGYVSGTHGWWLAGIMVVGMYIIVYNLITAGGHGHH